MSDFRIGPFPMTVNEASLIWSSSLQRAFGLLRPKTSQAPFSATMTAPCGPNEKRGVRARRIQKHFISHQAGKHAYLSACAFAQGQRFFGICQRYGLFCKSGNRDSVFGSTVKDAGFFCACKYAGRAFAGNYRHRRASRSFRMQSHLCFFGWLYGINTENLRAEW